MKYPTKSEAAAQIVSYGKRLYDRGYAAANDGNLSVKLSDDTILCTPTGVSKGCLTPEMLVEMALDGRVLSQGTLPPSSEVKMHLRVYQENPAVMAVVHVHPPVASSFAAAGIPLDTPLLTEAIVGLGPVPLAPFALPSTEEVPDSVAPFCRTHKAVLLSNHGPLTWGASLEEACFRMEILEHLATVTMNVCYVMRDTHNKLSEENIARLKKQFHVE